MKYSVLLTVSLLTINILVAQTDSIQSSNEFKTLFSNNAEKTKISGFGSVNIDFGSIENNFGLMIGGEGAILLNRKFYIGFYGRGLATLPKYEFEESTNNNFDVERRGVMGYGGLVIGTIFKPTKPIHFGLDLRIGGGTVGLIYSYEYYQHNPNLYYSENSHKSIFAFAPEGFVEMNIAAWFKIKFSASYQYISDASVTAPIVEDGKFVTDGNGHIVTEEVFTTQNYRTPEFSIGFVF